MRTRRSLKLDPWRPRSLGCHLQHSCFCSLKTVSDIVRTRVLHSQAQAANSAPVCQEGNLTLAHVSNGDIFLVVVVRNNANIMMALQWLNAVRGPPRQPCHSACGIWQRQETLPLTV
jgi:hypothetical protein